MRPNRFGNTKRLIGAVVLGALVAFAASGLAAEPQAFKETVFDVPALTATPLNPKVLKSTEKDGIVTEDVMFHSENDGAKSVDIFALFSYPAGGKKLPAFVWNQGGLGQATTYWTEFGARRGYATLCIDFPMPGYRSTGGYTITAGLDLGDDPRQAPIYHGAVALLKAVSYLESRAEVDKNRIGMAGSSWGGFYTTLMIGVDPRLKAGSAMFGTGNLQLGNCWSLKLDNEAGRDRWLKTLDPAWRLQYSKTPIAWFTGTQDFAYWMPSVMATHAMAAGPKHLTLLANWDHGLTPNLDEQVFAWLDTHLKGAPSFIQLTPLQVSKKEDDLLAEWTARGPRKIASAELILSYGDAGNWQSRNWNVLQAEIKDGVCTAKLPVTSTVYYISGAVLDSDTFRYSTPMLRVNSTEFGAKGFPASWNYDGAAYWGGFEEDQVLRYLDPLAWAHPPVSQDAHEGKQSAMLKAGKTTLPRLFFTVGVPHRFTAYLKADKSTPLTLELGGEFDGQAKSEQQQFQIGTDWTRIELDFTPPKASLAKVVATLTVPDGCTALLDSVSFRPTRSAGADPMP